MEKEIFVEPEVKITDIKISDILTGPSSNYGGTGFEGGDDGKGDGSDAA